MIAVETDASGTLSNPQIAVNNNTVGGGSRAYVTKTDSTGGEVFVRGSYILEDGTVISGANGAVWDAAQNSAESFTGMRTVQS